MVNIKRNHVLCKKHDISHSKKSGCKLCKLDIDNYDTSSKYIKDKVYNQFKDNLIEKIKKKFKNHGYMEIYTNIMNNTIDKRTIKLKLIEDERDRLRYVRNLKLERRKYPIKSEVNYLYKKTIELNKSKRKIYNRFKDTNYKYINNYIENEINIYTMEYKILKKKINSINLKIKEIIRNKKEADYKKCIEDLEKSKLEDELKEKERLEYYNNNQEKMKTYNKEVLRYDINSREAIYICSVCELEGDLSLDCLEQEWVMKKHFKLKLHIDNFNTNVSVKIKKSIEGKFIDIIFDFKKLQNNHIYEDLHLKKIIKKKVNENRKENKEYKTTILKIYNQHPDIQCLIDEIKTAKIVSYDIMKSIDNLEYLESELLDKKSPEDKLFFKYGKEIEIGGDYENFIKSDEYKNVTKYLKDNNINEALIDEHISFIHNYLNSNNKNDLELLKKAILNRENAKYSNMINHILIENEKPRMSGASFQIGEGGVMLNKNLRCVIKMIEYTPIPGGNISELNKIPDLFLNKRSLLVLKNNDNKCFLYCYIREFLNPITRNKFKITKRDKELADKIINDTNLTFENVSISEMNKIEKKLKVNINVFSCNKNHKNKNPVRKSRENYDKILDL